MERDVFDELTRSREAEYFARRDQELIEEMKQRRGKHAALAEHVGTNDPEILQALTDLGFVPETADLLHLLPLVEVAWADGSVSSSEHRSVLAAAATRGVTPDAAAHVQLTAWLANRPSEEFCAVARDNLRRLLEALPVDKGEALARGLLGFATQVAAVSGGFLGFGQPISPLERVVLDRLGHELPVGGVTGQVSRSTRRKAAP